MQCRWCGRSIKDAEAVHRVSMPYAFPWPDGPYPLIGYICTDCSAATSSSDSTLGLFGTNWLDPIPCCHCKRPVIHDARRKLPKYVVCSEECQRAIYRALSFERRELGDRRCRVCDKMFLPKKANVLYCSGSCRQRAYRQSRDSV